LLPFFLKFEFGFWLSLGAAAAGTAVCYFITLFLMRTFA
jgi:hypothetical protein